jgi:hypothetical protein
MKGKVKIQNVPFYLKWVSGCYTIVHSFEH